MKYSTSIEYAIHGLLYIATVESETPVLVSDVASATRIPEAYLRKLFQQLARSGILSSQRGPRGGFRLVRSPDEINLKEIIESIDGSLPEYTCMKTMRGCRLKKPCPVHEAFEEAKRRMADVFRSTTLQSLLVHISGQESVAGWLPVNV